METRLDSFVTLLTANHRALLLGGLAVVRHGFSRYTKDADIWLEPLDSPQAWAALVAETMTRFPDAKAMRLFPQRIIPKSELAAAIEDDRVVRITGLEMPLDIFREPNEMENFSFDEAYHSAVEFQRNFKILSMVDLLKSKENTGRERDRHDVSFLESEIRKDWAAKLRSCDEPTARTLLERYMDHAVLESALDNPAPAVQELARVNLRKFAEEGNPYAIDAWQKRFGPL